MFEMESVMDLVVAVMLVPPLLGGFIYGFAWLLLWAEDRQVRKNEEEKQ